MKACMIMRANGRTGVESVATRRKARCTPSGLTVGLSALPRADGLGGSGLASAACPRRQAAPLAHIHQGRETNTAPAAARGRAISLTGESKEAAATGRLLVTAYSEAKGGLQVPPLPLTGGGLDT